MFEQLMAEGLRESETYEELQEKIICLLIKKKLIILKMLSVI